MKKIIRIINTQEPNVLDIRFWPTDICNFDCSYCFPNSKDAIYRYPKNIKTVIKNFRLLFDFYKEKFSKDEFRVNLVGGGEPTLWPHFKEFCEGIKETHKIRLQVTTNGSRTLRWWEENYQLLDKVVLSTHHEFCNIEHQKRVADFIFSKDIIVDALVLMDHMHWDKCVNIVESFKQSKYPWIVEVKAIVDSPGRDVNSYTSEQLEYMKNSFKRLPDSDWVIKKIDLLNPFKSVALFDDGSAKAFKPDEYISSKKNGFYNWKCDVAKENLVITYDGSVSGSCQERIFKNSNLNMFSETFEVDFLKAQVELDTITCSSLLCGCTPDTHISKSRS
jgi:organic radical activating enzyme